MSAVESTQAANVHPFVGMDVPTLLRSRASARPDQPFLIWAPFDMPSRTWTYAEFHDRVGALAAGFVARGLQRNDSLLIHLDNCIELLLTWFACAEIGVKAVTTNTRATGAELNYLADACEATAAITQPAFTDLIAGQCRALRWVAVIPHDPNGSGQAAVPCGRNDAFETLFKNDAVRRLR